MDLNIDNSTLNIPRPLLRPLGPRPCLHPSALGPHPSAPKPYNSRMRGCAAILSFILTVPLFPQCPYSHVASIPFRSTAYDVAIDGNDLWLATGYGVALYDRTVDPPKLTGLTPVA